MYEAGFGYQIMLLRSTNVTDSIREFSVLAQ
jgi:hypothetical protein